MAAELEAIEVRDDEPFLKTVGHVPMEIDMIVFEPPLHDLVRSRTITSQGRATKLDGDGGAANSFCLVDQLSIS